MRLLSLIAVLLAWSCATGEAFSPYEAYLMSGRPTHVGLIAEVAPEQRDLLEDQFRRIASGDGQAKLAAAGITSLHAFVRSIEGADYVVVYFAYDGQRPYLGAAEAFENATAEADWPACTTQHPRAQRYGRQWLQMEWINFIRGLNVQRPPTSNLMIATKVVPEKEQQYRTLHQTTWPGVVDQAVRGNIRNLCVFLVELDDHLVEFLHLEYMGDDEQADDKANKADPINQRWWKLTDACQRPFSDVKEGNWTSMTPLP